MNTNCNSTKQIQIGLIEIGAKKKEGNKTIEREPANEWKIWIKDIKEKKEYKKKRK